MGKFCLELFLGSGLNGGAILSQGQLSFQAGGFGFSGLHTQSGCTQPQDVLQSQSFLTLHPATLQVQLLFTQLPAPPLLPQLFPVFLQLWL